MKTKLLQQYVLDCYRELYANATPKADFDELLKNATVNEQGQKEIPFMDYSLSKADFEKITNKYLKKIKPPYYQRAFRMEIFLGVSPRTV